jgi:signal transduction histidine kinase
MGSIDYLKSFGFPAFPVSSFAMAAFGLLNAYAIVRHRFLDIEVIVKKGAVYTTLTAVITLSYAGMMMLANMLFEGTSQSLAVNAVAVIIIAFAFQPLRNGIQILVDRWFYRSRYNYRQTLRAFGAEIIRTVGRRETALRLVHTVTETVHIGHACVAWKEKGESGYRILAERAMGGEAVFFEAGRPLEAPGVFDDTFRKGAEVLDREELGLLAQDAPSSQEKESLLSAASWLKTLGYELVIPVLVKDDMTALFLLSAKLSEAAYTAQDVELLQICANQAGVAIESSVLYDRLERSRRLAVLGEMASGVAHEIKNPLQSIKIFVESLDDNFHDPVFRENFASVVLPQIDGLDRMVRDLLEYARPPRLLKVEADVLDLVRITLRLLEGDILNLGVTVRFDKTSNPVLVSCDGEKIKRVLLNVIQNALDAVKDCEPKEVEISAALGDGWAVVEVVDSGVGIPEENIKKLFRPFFTTKEEGTGLGLALAQKTVEDHNGSMSVSSAHGLGTKVTIRLPALGGAE